MRVETTCPLTQQSSAPTPTFVWMWEFATCLDRGSVNCPPEMYVLMGVSAGGLHPRQQKGLSSLRYVPGLSLRRPIQLKYLALMPVAGHAPWSAQHGVPLAIIA